MPSNDKDYDKKYYLANKEYFRKRKREWYLKNREKALAYQHEWNRLNRPSKRAVEGRTKTVSGKVRVVLPRKYNRSRDNSSVSGQEGSPTGEHDRPVPKVPRRNSRAGKSKDNPVSE